MNDENLRNGKATQFRSGEEAARNGEKGGVASGKTRREKKAVRQVILDVLYADSPNGGTVLEEMISGMIERVSKTGDQNTFEKLMEYANMSPERKRKDAELKLKKDQLAIAEGTAKAGDDPCLAVLEQIREAVNDAEQH